MRESFRYYEDNGKSHLVMDICYDWRGKYMSEHYFFSPVSYDSVNILPDTFFYELKKNLPNLPKKLDTTQQGILSVPKMQVIYDFISQYEKIGISEKKEEELCSKILSWNNFDVQMLFMTAYLFAASDNACCEAYNIIIKLFELSKKSLTASHIAHLLNYSDTNEFITDFQEYIDIVVPIYVKNILCEDYCYRAFRRYLVVQTILSDKCKNELSEKVFGLLDTIANKRANTLKNIKLKDIKYHNVENDFFYELYCKTNLNSSKFLKKAKRNLALCKVMLYSFKILRMIASFAIICILIIGIVYCKKII